MKYLEVMRKIKEGSEIRYHFNGFVDGDTYTLFWNDENEQCRLHHQTVKKIMKEHNWKHRAYAVEGMEETGWLDIESSK